MNEVFEEFCINESVNIGIQYRGVTTWTKGKISFKNGNFITVDFGKYKECFSYTDIISGDVLIKREDKIMGNSKVCRDDLIKKVIEYGGFNNEIAEKLAKDFGVAITTIKTYFYKWEINKAIEKLEDTKNMKILGDNAVPKQEKKSKTISRLLKMVFGGNVCYYELDENHVILRNLDNTEKISIKYEALEDFKKEIIELCERV